MMGFDGVRLDVPYSEKEDAKAVGARWDPQEKTWYLPSTIELTAQHARWVNIPEASGMHLSVSMIMSNGERVLMGTTPVAQENLALNEVRYFVRVLGNYPCFFCRTKLNLLQTFKNEPTDIKAIDLFDGCETYRTDKSLIAFAQTLGVSMGFRKTSVVPSPYVIHVCPKCNRPQGDNFTLEDNHSFSELRVVRMLYAIHDTKNETWSIEEEIPN